MKIRLVGAELFRTDRHEETNSRLWQFCKRLYKPTWIMCKDPVGTAQQTHSVSVTLYTRIFPRHLHICYSSKETMQMFPNKPQHFYQRSSSAGRNCRCGSRVCTADCWPEVSVHPTETCRLPCQENKCETCTNFAGSEPPLLRKVSPSRFGKALNTVFSYGSPSNCTTCTVIVMWPHTIIMAVWKALISQWHCTQHTI